MRVFIHDYLDFPRVHAEFEWVGGIEGATPQEHDHAFVVSLSEGAVVSYKVLRLKGCDLAYGTPYAIDNSHPHSVVGLRVQAAYNTSSCIISSHFLEDFLSLDFHADPKLYFVLFLLVRQVDEFVLELSG